MGKKGKQGLLHRAPCGQFVIAAAGWAAFFTYLSKKAIDRCIAALKLFDRLWLSPGYS